MSRFESNNFYQDRPKIKFFCKKYLQKIFDLWISSPKPLCLPRSPLLDSELSPQLQIPGFSPEPVILFYFCSKTSSAATIFNDYLQSYFILKNSETCLFLIIILMYANIFHRDV